MTTFTHQLLSTEKSITEV